MLEDGEKMPTTIQNLDDLEKISRSEHRLINKVKEIWHKDQVYVYLTQKGLSDEQADKWLESQNFKVVTEKQAYPNRNKEALEASRHEPGFQIKSG